MDHDLHRPFYAELGGRVRRAREAAGLTQPELAKALGLTRSSVSNLEAGRQRPPLHLLAAIAQQTGQAWSDLLPPLELLEAASATDLPSDLTPYEVEALRRVQRRARLMDAS